MPLPCGGTAAAPAITGFRCHAVSRFGSLCPVSWLSRCVQPPDNWTGRFQRGQRGELSQAEGPGVVAATTAFANNYI